MLSVVMLNIIMLSVVMLSVVAPAQPQESRQHNKTPQQGMSEIGFLTYTIVFKMNGMFVKKNE